MWWKDRLQIRLKRPTILSPTNQHQCARPMIMRTRLPWLPLASQSVHVHNGPRVSINNLYHSGIQYQCHKHNSQNVNNKIVWQCNGKQSLGWTQKQWKSFFLYPTMMASNVFESGPCHIYSLVTGLCQEQGTLWQNVFVCREKEEGLSFYWLQINCVFNHS